MDEVFPHSGILEDALHSPSTPESWEYGGVQYSRERTTHGPMKVVVVPRRQQEGGGREGELSSLPAQPDCAASLPTRAAPTPLWPPGPPTVPHHPELRKAIAFGRRQGERRLAVTQSSASTRHHRLHTRGSSRSCRHHAPDQAASCDELEAGSPRLAQGAKATERTSWGGRERGGPCSFPAAERPWRSTTDLCRSTRRRPRGRRGAHARLQ
jgi:hypothetical protein